MFWFDMVTNFIISAVSSFVGMDIKQDGESKTGQTQTEQRVV